jgi:prepilin peptidase CpaA
MLVQVILFVFVVLMIFAALTDITRFTIPNWLSAAVAVLFPVAALLAGFGWAEWGNHLLAGLIGLLLGMALFAPGWIGGGDAKLFAAASLWFGWPGATGFLMHTALAGGVLVIILLGLRQILPMLFNSSSWAKSSVLAKEAPVPYGVAIAAGAFWSLPGTSLMLASGFSII